jgi:hypothetical protein
LEKPKSGGGVEGNICHIILCCAESTNSIVLQNNSLQNNLTIISRRAPQSEMNVKKPLGNNGMLVCGKIETTANLPNF